MRNKIFLGTSVLLIMLIAVFFSATRDKGVVYKNVFIEDLDLSNLTKDEVKNKLQQYKINDLVLTDGKNQFTISSKQKTYSVDSDYLLDQAFNVGRDGTFLENRFNFVKFYLFNKQVTLPIKFNVNKLKLKDEIKGIAEKVNIDSTNAKLSYDNGEFIITDHIDGVTLNEESTLNVVENALKNLVFKDIMLSLDVSPAPITSELLSKIDTLLGEFSTNFNPGSAARSSNIRTASASLNSVVLLPDETLSFNETTGARSSSRGYKMAPVIVKGELVPGSGGGVCQVSTTLFNAGALAGLNIVERQNHSMPVGYIGVGRDATVSYGSIDLKIQNNYSNPVYFLSYVNGGTLRIKVYGNSSDKLDDVKIYSVVNRTIPRATKVLKSGTPANGKDGIQSSTYRVIVKNGEKKQELLSSSYYPPKQRVVVEEPKNTLAIQNDISNTSSSPNTLIVEASLD